MTRKQACLAMNRVFGALRADMKARPHRWSRERRTEANERRAGIQTAFAIADQLAAEESNDEPATYAGVIRRCENLERDFLPSGANR